MVMLVPANSSAGTKCLCNLVGVLDNRRNNLERSRNVRRTVFLGQCERLLRSEKIPATGWVESDIATRSLCCQPLAHAALVSCCLFGKLGGANRLRTIHSLVQAKFISQQHQGCA